MSGQNQESVVERLMENALHASAVFNQYKQSQVDQILKTAYHAAFNNRVRLAKLAHEETHIGKWEDKVIKNVVASQLVYHNIKNQKTVGVIANDPITGIVEIAQPMGPILAVIPVTNPTSTVIFKTLISLKTRNPVIICPSGKARECCAETARILYAAALEADAPENCIQWCSTVSREQTQALMTHKDIALILATGGTGLVKSAYSSGTPTIGVGSGNVPVFIERTADIPFTVDQIYISKTFDNGTICASEQAIVVEDCIADSVIEEFKRRKAYILNPEETQRLESVAFDQQKGLMNPEVVGQTAFSIAQRANLPVSSDVSMLIAPLKGVGAKYPLSSEILAPILAYYREPTFESAVKRCIELNYHGGLGHSASVFSNDDEKILSFANLMDAGRIVVNTPSSQGAVGGIYNMLSPSFTLGCGTGGKNITTDNVTARHLLNIQRIARRRDNHLLMRLDSHLYLDESLKAEEIDRLYTKNI